MPKAIKMGLKCDEIHVSIKSNLAYAISEIFMVALRKKNFQGKYD